MRSWCTNHRHRCSEVVASADDGVMPPRRKEAIKHIKGVTFPRGGHYSKIDKQGNLDRVRAGWSRSDPRRVRRRRSAFVGVSAHWRWDVIPCWSKCCCRLRCLSCARPGGRWPKVGEARLDKGRGPCCNCAGFSPVRESGATWWWPVRRSARFAHTQGKNVNISKRQVLRFHGGNQVSLTYHKLVMISSRGRRTNVVKSRPTELVSSTQYQLMTTGVQLENMFSEHQRPLVEVKDTAIIQDRRSRLETLAQSLLVVDWWSGSLSAAVGGISESDVIWRARVRGGTDRPCARC
jgi:hypothetical protein